MCTNFLKRKPNGDFWLEHRNGFVSCFFFFFLAKLKVLPSFRLIRLKCCSIENVGC